MRRTASEKMEIIRLVEGTDLPVRATLRQMNIARSTFYNWYQRYEIFGFDGLHDRKPVPRPRWNAIPEKAQKQVLDLALERTDLSPRELACRFAISMPTQAVVCVLERIEVMAGPPEWGLNAHFDPTKVRSVMASS